jgi:uncharacterized membrane protein YbhN (UPF0104 family)
MRLDRSLFELLESPVSSEPVSGHAVPYGLEATSPHAVGPTQSQILGRIAGVGVALLLMVLSLVTLKRTLHGVAWADVGTALTAVPAAYILVSLLLTGLSYLALTGYDVLGLNYLGKRLPYPKVALGSFLSYAFANNLGFALLTGGSARYRIYAPAGLRGADIALLTLICGLTFALSGSLVAALCLVLEPTALGRLIGLAPWLTLLAGLALLGGLGAYVGWVGAEPRSLRWGLRELPLPGARSTVAQLLVGLADLTFAAGALYLLLPASTDIGFLLFIGVFAVAMMLGLLSHVPGGIGVFETVILLAVSGAPTTGILASLLVFRCIYYLVPLAIALGLFAWHEAAGLPKLDRARAIATHTSKMAFRAAGRIMEIAGQWTWLLAGMIWRRFFATAGRA